MEELINKLNGRDYRNLLSIEELEFCKKEGFLVMYKDFEEYKGVINYKNPLIYFKGIIDDCSGKEIHIIKRDGVLVLEGEDQLAEIEYHGYDVKSIKIVANYDYKVENNEWVIDMQYPKIKNKGIFTILDNGKPFCKGLILHKKDILKKL